MNIPTDISHSVRCQWFHHHRDQCTCYKGVDATVYKTPLLPITCESFMKRWLARFLSIFLVSWELFFSRAFSLSGCFFCLLGTMGGGLVVESPVEPLFSVLEWGSWPEDLVCTGGTTAPVWVDGATWLGTPFVDGTLLCSGDCLILLGLLLV